MEETDVNAEIRYITLELMKMSAITGKPFKKLASEFVKNAHFLRKLIQLEE